MARSLSQRRLKQLLHYDPRTGRFTWRMNRQGPGAKKGRTAGAISTKGYRQIKIDQKIYCAAPLAFIWMTGRRPPQVDHINLKKDDNRWSNLRSATPSQNTANSRISSKNSVGLKGVTFNKQKGQYIAQIKVRNRWIYLGRHNTARAAHLAYIAAARKHFGEFARPA